MDDGDKLSVYRVFEPKNIEPIRQFKKEKRERRREYKRQEKNNPPKEGFKKNFLEHFGLDENRFSVNLINREDKWLVEICNRKTRECVYQDYDVLCSLLDRLCRLPDEMVGFNVNMEV